MVGVLGARNDEGTVVTITGVMKILHSFTWLVTRANSYSVSNQLAECQPVILYSLLVIILSVAVQGKYFTVDMASIFVEENLVAFALFFTRKPLKI